MLLCRLNCGYFLKALDAILAKFIHLKKEPFMLQLMLSYLYYQLFFLLITFCLLKKKDSMLVSLTHNNLLECKILYDNLIDNLKVELL